jgi:hypothetical protein
MRVGVVGYSGQKFDGEKAGLLLIESFIEMRDLTKSPEIDFKGDFAWTKQLTIVSGLTNVGIPAIAYKFSEAYSCKTMGIACSKAQNFDCYPCDRVHIVGTEWGDESETFLASIDVLIRIGGGKQSHAECQRAKDLGIHVIEKELEALP